jgi:hypothetical protein
MVEFRYNDLIRYIEDVADMRLEMREDEGPIEAFIRGLRRCEDRASEAVVIMVLENKVMVNSSALVKWVSIDDQVSPPI